MASLASRHYAKSLSLRPVQDSNNLSKGMNDKKSYREEYLLKTPVYENLGKSLCSAIELILLENGIDFLKIYYRVKDLDSFIEKNDRKAYSNPFEQTEDICGIRVICYFQKDVERINEILKKELDIKDSQDKEDLLELNQFGYRSYHLIAQIPEDWFKTPNFRNLKELKAEIQVRTVLMHAWAEIEHKLSYKKKSHIPDDFRRKLFRLSAKLEESDEQFQELKEKSETFQKNILTKAKAKQIDFTKINTLDLDTFQAYLDFRFSDREKSIEQTRRLLDELTRQNINIKDIESGFNQIHEHLDSIEEDIFEDEKKGWAQVGIVRQILDLTNEEYTKNREEHWKKKSLIFKQKYKI